MYKQKNKNQTLAVSLLIRTLILTACYLLGAAVATLILFFSKDPGANTSLYSLISFLISGAVGGIVMGRKQDTLIMKIFPGVIFALLLVLLSPILGGHIAKTLMNIICYLPIFALFCYLSSIRRTGNKRRKWH